ncbi:MAG: TauD/TfdA family dioxygenase [Lewinellaceae bacterium]|nr:TauD/TfdA family dioxygenase [Lewinellaceae bacterium]
MNDKIKILQTSENSFIELAKTLGKPISSRRDNKIIDVLTPKRKEDAHPQSISKKIGLGRFPYHTDGAYFKIPPRYVLLRCKQVGENQIPTQIVDVMDLANKDELFELGFRTWKVSCRNGTFYSPILNKRVLRYDLNVMQPYSESDNNSNIIDDIIGRSTPIEINWEIGKTIVLDNWACLHARPKVDENSTTRTLQRIMII